MNPAEILAVLSAATQNPGARYEISTTQGDHYPSLHLQSFSNHWQHNRALETYLSFLDDASREIVLSGSLLATMELQKIWLKKNPPKPKPAT